MSTQRDGHQAPREGMGVRAGPARGKPGGTVADGVGGAVDQRVGLGGWLSQSDLLRLQGTIGNKATGCLVGGTPCGAIQRNGEKEKAATLLQAAIRGYQVREQVRVRGEAPGIVGVRVRNTEPSGRPSVLGDISGGPLDTIRSPLKGQSEYNHLKVVGGAMQGGVFGPGTGQPPTQVRALAQGLPEGTAVINGGYFAHHAGMKSEEGSQPSGPIQGGTMPLGEAYDKEAGLRPVGQSGVGRPVGPTSTRTDPLPVPSEYADFYGQVNVGGAVGLSSGPMLAHGGQAVPIPGDDRFKYRLPIEGEAPIENPRNSQAGVLTHAGDRNARSAISVKGDDVVMHTVTDPTMAPGAGVTMAQWQAMTMAGARSGDIREGAQPGSTLNLDGGGSVYMGVTGADGAMKVVAKGQRPTEQVERPVGNIIASRPTTG